MDRTFIKTAPIDDTMRRVVVGFRLVAVAWMGAMVAATLVTDDQAHLIVVGATYGGVLAWTGVTVFLALHPRWFRNPVWLALDGVVALWVSVSPFVANSRDLFFGAYPLSSLLLVASVGGVWPSLVAAGALASGQIIGHLDRAGHTATQGAGEVGAFLVAAVAFGWGVTTLRRYDLARAEARQAFEEERAARQRALDRAEIAAHLHDSVLQTLAMIQRDPSDPRRIAALARSQERQLREYLDQIASQHSPSLRAALRRVAGEVEDLFLVRVEAVVVGDATVDASLEALVQATHEALANAAKHSGKAEVSLFAEVTPAAVTVNVRDRGCGFDPSQAITGRGLVESIVARLERVGGTALIQSTPGEGTEVELHLGRSHG